MFKALYHFFHRHYHLRYHGVYRRAKQLFVFDIALLGLALFFFAATLFFYFWNPPLTTLIDLNISVGTNRISSGAPIHVSISYSNRSKQKLNNGIMALRLPPGFVVDRNKTPLTIFTNNNTFLLPSIEPGGNGTLQLDGWLWAEPRQEEKIVSILTYERSDTKQIEQKIGTFLLSAIDSVVKSELQIPTSSLANRPIPFTFKITNNGEVALPLITLSFSPDKITTDLDKNHTRDLTIALTPHASKIITGTVPATALRSSLEVTITPRVLINNQQLIQSPIGQTISFISPAVSSGVKLTQPVAYLEPGQNFPLEIQWSNNTSFELKKLRLRLAFTAGFVDLKTTAINNHAVIDGQGLIFDSSSRTALANGHGPANDAFIVTVYLLPRFSAPVQSSNASNNDRASLQIKPSLEAEIEQIQNQKFSQEGETLSVPLATEVRIQREIRYYTDEGDQLGRGPLPPRVGETTKYWVFIRISNTFNALSDAVFHVTLAPGINFTGKQSVTLGPELVYNSGIKTLDWNYSLVPANSQTGFYFEISITPTPEQIGHLLPILTSSIFKAQDSSVGKVFSISSSGLDNTLTTRDRGVNRGAAVLN